MALVMPFGNFDVSLGDVFEMSNGERVVALCQTEDESSTQLDGWACAYIQDNGEYGPTTILWANEPVKHVGKVRRMGVEYY